mmetsp:Transcript_8068/g.25627  ORF Transcript_8068/g.25627 Transcript_8068/m.25627 type:complete len:276 (+) Transcript_8068:385-1212(+)
MKAASAAAWCVKASVKVGPTGGELGRVSRLAVGGMQAQKGLVVPPASLAPPASRRYRVGEGEWGGWTGCGPRCTREEVHFCRRDWVDPLLDHLPSQLEDRRCADQQRRAQPLRIVVLHRADKRLELAGVRPVGELPARHVKEHDVRWPEPWKPLGKVDDHSRVFCRVVLGRPPQGELYPEQADRLAVVGIRLRAERPPAALLHGADAAVLRDGAGAIFADPRQVLAQHRGRVLCRALARAKEAEARGLVDIVELRAELYERVMLRQAVLGWHGEE